jgi:hypothetical protein
VVVKDFMVVVLDQQVQQIVETVAVVVTDTLDQAWGLQVVLALLFCVIWSRGNNGW